MLICKIILFLYIGNLIVCFIFAYLAKKLSTTKKTDKSSVMTHKSKTLYAKLKAYLTGFIDINIRLIGFIPSFRVRKFIYQNIFQMRIGHGTKIRAFSTFYHPWNIVIGNNTMIGQNCIIDGRRGISIGNNVNISDFVAIYTAGHDVNSVLFEGTGGPVSIGHRTWLSFRSIILHSVKIAEGVVVSANAVVTKDCEDFSVYMGIPARKKANRNKDISYQLDIEGLHFI